MEMPVGPSRRARWAAHLSNIGHLLVKELRSIRADPVMLVLVAYAFSLAVYTVSTGASTEARNLAVGIVDEDRSDLSRSLAAVLTPPLFKPPVPISAAQIDPQMDAGTLGFVIEIPPDLQSDLLRGRTGSVQIDVDATAISQAGIGAGYLQQIIQREVTAFLQRRDVPDSTPVSLVTRVRFNPNLVSAWFTSAMQVINNITMLTIILTGAALIREREQGTVEHVLVMPILPAELMLAKILANGLVILVAALLSLAVMVQGVLGVPIAGSLLLFAAGAALYCFVVAALGILLATIATSMGQFGLLAMPLLVAMNLLSGASTPFQSMPVWLQALVAVASPTPHFVAFAQAVLFRGAGADVVWPRVLAMAAIGSVYVAVSLRRFRRVIFEA